MFKVSYCAGRFIQINDARGEQTDQSKDAQGRVGGKSWRMSVLRRVWHCRRLGLGGMCIVCRTNHEGHKV